MTARFHHCTFAIMHLHAYLISPRTSTSALVLIVRLLRSPRGQRPQQTSPSRGLGLPGQTGAKVDLLRIGRLSSTRRNDPHRHDGLLHERSLEMLALCRLDCLINDDEEDGGDA